MRLTAFPCALSIAAVAVLAAAPCASPQISISGDREIDRKVEALLRKMTVEEKIGQLTQSFHFVNNAKRLRNATNSIHFQIAYKTFRHKPLTGKEFR